MILGFASSANFVGTGRLCERRLERAWGRRLGAGERLPGSLWSFVTAFSCGTRPLRVFSGRGERAAAEQLQQVVCQADQVPFGFHLGEAAEQELSEASTVLDLPIVLDLAEGRFDDCLATGVVSPAALRAQFASRLFFHAQRLSEKKPLVFRVPRSWICMAVLFSGRRHGHAKP